MTCKDIAKSIYFVGIGGVSMSGLAEHLQRLGYDVSGSDRAPNEYTQRLQKLGVPIHFGEQQTITTQLVVKTSAVDDLHPQIIQAKEGGIPVILREQLLGAVFNNYATRIAICGTHGKTTATALLHHVLERCGIEHTAFIGGKYLGKNYFCNGDKLVVAEACEYNQSFLYLRPTHTLCLNAEYDHPDCYQSVDDMRKAFAKLFEQSQKVTLPSSLKGLCAKADCYDNFVAKNVDLQTKGVTFELFYRHKFLTDCRLKITGNHNVENALAVLGLCRQLRLPVLQVAHAMSSFEGADRRWTEKSYRCRLICDYAHHPTEIKATVDTAKQLTTGRVVCVFQPHTYTRTKAFWLQFASCFANTTVIYLPIYPAREQPIYGVTSQKLCDCAQKLGVDARFVENFAQAEKVVKELITPQDTLLILGAGDVAQLANALSAKHQSNL